MRSRLRPSFALSGIILLAAIGLSGCAPENAPARADGTHVVLAGLPPGRVTSGERLAARKNAQTGLACNDCHGAGGNRPSAATYPQIGGQYDDYLAYALVAYRRKRRSHPVMQFYAHPLTDQEIADLAVYFGAQPSQLHPIE